MILQETLLQDEFGKFYFKGLIATPFQQHLTKDQYMVIVGDPAAQEMKIWLSPQSKDLNPIVAALSACQWYLLNNPAPKGYPDAKPLPIPTPEAKSDKPEV